MLERMWRKGRALLHCLLECKLVQPLWETVWKFLRKLNIELPYDLAIPLLGIYPDKTTIQKDTCTCMFIAEMCARVSSDLESVRAELATSCWEYKLVQPLWKTVEIPQKTKYRTTIWSSDPTPGHISRQNSNSERYMHPYVHSSTIYNSKIWK